MTTPLPLRQKLKKITQVIGIYPMIRDTKESLYWKIENWRWPLLRQLHGLLEVSAQDIRRLSDEYDAAGLWQRIYREITKEFTSDPNYWHGASSQQDLRALYILCRVLKPQIAIETGVASGASASVLLEALRKNDKGELYSIDLSPTIWAPKLPDYRQRDKVTLPGEKTVGWLVPENLKNRWHLNVGDSKELLPKILQSVGTCDLFYHDAAHTYEAMLWEFQTVWPTLAPGGIITSDDVHWNTAFKEFAASQRKTITKAYTWRGFGMLRKSPKQPSFELIAD